MKAMTVGELKTHFSKVLEEVKQGNKVDILYGRTKKPVATLSPYREERTGRRKLGILEGIATFEEVGDGKITLEEFFGEDFKNKLKTEIFISTE